ncbi:unnamed protein product [Colias eurytheme]|nr:unnamed protein product [Colias eurytheme]
MKSKSNISKRSREAKRKRRALSKETEEQRQTRLAKTRERVAYLRSKKICQKRAEKLTNESPTLCDKRLAGDSEQCVACHTADEMTGCNEHLNDECEVLVKSEIKDEIEISEDPLLVERTNSPSIDNFQ